MPTLKNKKTQKKSTKSRPKSKRKTKPKRLDKKEILKEKPFSDNTLSKKQEVNTLTIVAPIIFFVLTLAAFGYNIFMPNEMYIELITSVGFVCFVLFIITFVYSMMKLNKC
ncbi:hypothetical protein KO317_03560 [Candidatus Micrarchaeota archaeon]|jgi:hypothetical protein|nr:hypothetical protein [Candidatus Micrarchaeota archaeon]